MKRRALRRALRWPALCALPCALPCALLVLSGCGVLHAPAPADPIPAWQPGGPEGLSPAVQARIARYPTDGSWGYHWPPDDGIWFGTAEEVRYRGEVLSPADPLRRSHCVGLTWEVAMAVLSAAAGGDDQPIHGMSADQIREFRRIWFVERIGGRGAAEAVERAGVGISVPLAQARPGDFLQLWSCVDDTPESCGAGHSAIFQSWLTDPAGQVTGVRFWSTWPGLGISVTALPFGPAGFDADHTYAARLMPDPPE